MFCVCVCVCCMDRDVINAHSLVTLFNSGYYRSKSCNLNYNLNKSSYRASRSVIINIATIVYVYIYAMENVIQKQALNDRAYKPIIFEFKNGLVCSLHFI